MKYVILPVCKANIKLYYRHVAMKYSNTYSLEQMCRNIDEAMSAIYKIENGLLRRQPTIEDWKDCYMANTKKWYFAYRTFGDTIVVIDARHARNMH